MADIFEINKAIEMKKNIFFYIMATILIGAISVGFSSCSKDNKVPDSDNLSRKIIGKKWNATILGPNNYVLFKEDGTYTCILESETLGGIYFNGMNINGMFQIKETEETKFGEFDATLFKMLASGSNDFDQLWVYHYIASVDGHHSAISVHFYSGNELVRSRGFQDDVW
jgi:hypothetical protein